MRTSEVHLRAERGSLLHLNQGGKKRAIQLSCAGSFHLGFNDELVARFPDRAVRRELPKGVLDRLGIRAADACLELEFIRVATVVTSSQCRYIRNLPYGRR